MPTPYLVSDDSITHSLKVIGSPETDVAILLRELRRERTGLHALVVIREANRILAHDTFNVGRSEDRRKLAKAAHGVMDATTKAVLGFEDLAHEMDAVCLYAAMEWESSRVEIIDVDPNAPAPSRVMLLFPHVEQGTGTIIFGVPGSGKSYLMDLMAVSLATGGKTLWVGARRSPVLYVDLERNAVAFQRRLGQIQRAMGVKLPYIQYLKGRGLALSSLRKKLRDWTRDHPGGVILYDSISRMGGGSLVQDDTANAIIDLANGASDTWVALAHSPRADDGHAYGSQMFDAGADMMIKLTSEHRSAKLGCALTVTKANHTGAVPVMTYELEFDEHGLTRFGAVTQADWPELAPSLPDLLAALLDGQEMTATDLAAKTRTPRMTVHDQLTKDTRFEQRRKTGKEVFWGLTSQPF